MNNNINNINDANNNQNGNEEEINGKKIIEIEKKSALPILSVGAVWLLFALIFNLHTFTQYFLATVLSFAAYMIVKKKCPPKKTIIEVSRKTPAKPRREDSAAKIPLTPEERELKDLNERIDLYFIEMKLLNDSIGDEFISNELLEIENILQKIKTQLNDDAKSGKLTGLAQDRRNEQLNQFFDYYMPTMIKILNSYKGIEKQNLTGENAMETKKRVEESLPFVRKAFEKELDNMFSDEMLDITTDIDVLESMLSKEGLIDKNTIGGIRDVRQDIENDFF